MMTARKRHLFGVLSTSVHEDRQLVGRIRYDSERNPRALAVDVHRLASGSAVRGSWLAR